MADNLLHAMVESVQQATRMVATMRSPRELAQAPADKVGLLTAADLAIDQHLRSALAQLAPDDGILTEESGITGGSHTDCTWVIDPLDGTKEFAASIPECAIVVAHFRPELALGIVQNLLTHELAWAEAGSARSDNLHASELTDLSRARITVSRSEHKRGWWSDFGLPTLPVGSIAWKIAQVALGQAEATITYTPKSVWDVAGAIFLAQTAGCVITDGAGRPLALNPRSIELKHGIIVASPGIAAELIAHTVPWIARRPANQMDAR